MFYQHVHLSFKTYFKFGVYLFTSHGRLKLKWFDNFQFERFRVQTFTRHTG